MIKTRNTYIPNAFSPNDDGVNDAFTIYGDRAVKQIRNLKVFSRWGELVFERSEFPAGNPKYGWDGTFRGKELQAGVYVWLAEIELLDGERMSAEGDVLIVR